MKNVILIALITFFASSNLLVAQENEHKTDKHQEDSKNSHESDHELKKHSLLFEFGFTHIPDGYDDLEGDQDIYVPTFGLAYMYYFNHKWAAGITVNMETESYLITYNNEELKRENALILTVLAKYEILPNWGVFAGPGIEIEEHHNLAVFRFGTEYAVPLPNNWFVAPILTFDYKEEYTTWELAVGIGKRF